MPDKINSRVISRAGSNPAVRSTIMPAPRWQMKAASSMALKTVRPILKTARPSKLRQLPSEGGANRAHYQSAEHRAWANEVKRRDGYRCVKCGASGESHRLIADHIIEITDGGSILDISNGQTLCGGCSNRKTAAARHRRLT
jgi:5-methylcytosine-specific restriction protein A